VQTERVFDHPIDEVFRRYTDHAGWSRWAGMGRVSLVREGSPDRNGVGAVRAFSTAPGLHEEVTRFEPPERMEYRIAKGGFPLGDHRGEVRFTPEGKGTRVNWQASFRSRIPGLGWALERGIELVFRKILAGLARDLDGRRG
jgi:uncharacterized protein YndB with AHSA1/START domain